MKLFDKMRTASEAVSDFPTQFAASLAMLTFAILTLAIAVFMIARS
jgi:hypothetical protein